MATQTLYVTADGAVTSGWNHEPVSGGWYSYVDEVGADDGDTTYLYSPVSGDIVTFVLQNTSGLSGATINSLTLHHMVKKLDPVDALTRMVLRIGGTNYESGNKNPVSNIAYEDLTEVYTLNPATSAAWTVSDIDNLEVGIKKENNAGERLTQIFVVVDYTSGGGFNSKLSSSFIGFF